MIRETKEGVVLSLRVTPKSARDAIEGLHRAADGSVSLSVRVRSVPDKGKANAAVIALLARTFGLAVSAITVKAGAAARNKTVLMRGEAAAIARAIEGFLTRKKA